LQFWKDAQCIAKLFAKNDIAEKEVEENTTTGFIMLMESSGYFFKFCLKARPWLDINVNSVPGPLSIGGVDSSD
jgi:hypothetical protein